jgi:hypothetical protein
MSELGALEADRLRWKSDEEAKRNDSGEDKIEALWRKVRT